MFLNINVIRALTGDYQIITLLKDEVKCQGFKNADLGIEKFLDIGHVDTLNVAKDIVFDFMRADIVFLGELKEENIVVVKRKDSKILKIKKSFLISENIGIKEMLGFGLARSIVNILISKIGTLEVNIFQDRVTILGKDDDNQESICFTVGHLELINFDYIVDLLLREVTDHRDIRIYCSGIRGELLDTVIFNVWNKRVKMTGDLKYMLSIIVKSAEYKDELKKAKSHQLKMKGF